MRPCIGLPLIITTFTAPVPLGDRLVYAETAQGGTWPIAKVSSSSLPSSGPSKSNQPLERPDWIRQRPALSTHSRRKLALRLFVLVNSHTPLLQQCTGTLPLRVCSAITQAGRVLQEPVIPSTCRSCRGEQVHLVFVGITPVSIDLSCFNVNVGKSSGFIRLKSVTRPPNRSRTSQ